MCENRQYYMHLCESKGIPFNKNMRKLELVKLAVGEDSPDVLAALCTKQFFIHLFKKNGIAFKKNMTKSQLFQLYQNHLDRDDFF